jgi:hypothetical protein
MRELTLDQEIEVVQLRVKRRQLLLEKTITDTERKFNQMKRRNVSNRLFVLTRNPIYIHF